MANLTLRSLGPATSGLACEVNEVRIKNSDKTIMNKLCFDEYLILQLCISSNVSGPSSSIGRLTPPQSHSRSVTIRIVCISLIQRK